MPGSIAPRILSIGGFIGRPSPVREAGPGEASRTPNPSSRDREDLSPASQAPPMPHEMREISHAAQQAGASVAAKIVGAHAPLADGRMCAPLCPVAQDDPVDGIRKAGPPIGRNIRRQIGNRYAEAT